MKCSLRSLYLCVSDMERAIRFYEDFLERPALVYDDIYSVFEIEGFRLGLFAYKKAGEIHAFGSNCLPSIEVENVSILEDKVKNLEICFPMTQIGTNWVAEFVDSEGNHVEITAPV